MGRYFLRFSYIGTHYRGLQKNTVSSLCDINDLDTVQGALECALSTLVPKCINYPKLITSSRTDIGVHALHSSAHVDLFNRYDAIYNPTEVIKTVNRYFAKCDHDIRLLEVTPVTNDFHARFLAKSRTYIYRFMVPKDYNDLRIPIVEKSKCYLVRSKTFDIEKLKRATQLFMGKKDFQTFSGKVHTDIPVKYVRKLNRLTVEKNQSLMPFDPLSERFDFWNIIISAQSFLYKQVRRIVAALLGVATDQVTERDVTIMLQVPGRHNWLTTLQIAPAYGLYLADIEYCQTELEKYIINVKESSYSKTVVSVNEDEVQLNMKI
ncbi:tRNA pseudouridine synthase A [Calliopsis andreniformis]|uniref:tRNA pseudouridine synthase A n=1 Tax=Calliopsis andreniformis TaxID=337506 RepID=UPI003FCDD719